MTRLDGSRTAHFCLAKAIEARDRFQAVTSFDRGLCTKEVKRQSDKWKGEKEIAENRRTGFPADLVPPFNLQQSEKSEIESMYCWSRTCRTDEVTLMAFREDQTRVPAPLDQITIEESNCVSTRCLSDHEAIPDKPEQHS